MFVITEGEVDAEFLRWMLSREIKEGKVAVRSAGGKSSAESLARSILAVKREPVALVIDADSVKAEAIEEQRSYYSFSLRQASGKTPFHIALFQPELETVVFHDRDLLRSISKRNLTEYERLEAQFKPKEVLSKLLEAPGTLHPLKAFTAAAGKASSDALKDHPEIRSLIGFLRDVTADQSTKPERPGSQGE